MNKNMNVNPNENLNMNVNVNENVQQDIGEESNSAHNLPNHSLDIFPSLFGSDRFHLVSSCFVWWVFVAMSMCCESLRSCLFKSRPKFFGASRTKTNEYGLYGGRVVMGIDAVSKDDKPWLQRCADASRVLSKRRCRKVPISLRSCVKLSESSWTVPAENGKQQHESRSLFPLLLKSIEQYFMVFLTFGRLGTSDLFSDTWTGTWPGYVWTGYVWADVWSGFPDTWHLSQACGRVQTENTSRSSSAWQPAEACFKCTHGDAFVGGPPTLEWSTLADVGSFGISSQRTWSKSTKPHLTTITHRSMAVVFVDFSLNVGPPCKARLLAMCHWRTCGWLHWRVKSSYWRCSGLLCERIGANGWPTTKCPHWPTHKQHLSNCVRSW